MKPIFKKIQDSFQLFSYKEDWDDEESPPLNEKAFIRTMLFLFSIIDSLGTNIESPYIMMGPNGSMDLRWKNKYNLLVNISENQISWYGDNGSRSEVTKGNQIEEVTYCFELIKWIKNNLLIKK